MSEVEESVERLIGPLGHYEKVSLPGESLWVKVINPPFMGTMVGKIDNEPTSSLHTIKRGDVVRFGWVVREFDGDAFGAWEPEGEV